MYWVVVMVRTNKLIGEGTVKISGTSKAMAWVAGAAVAAGVALATYPDAAPAVPPQVPSAEVLQSAVKVAGLIESSSAVDQVPNVSGYQRGCGKGEAPLTELDAERCRSEGVGSMWVGSLRT